MFQKKTLPPKEWLCLAQMRVIILSNLHPEPYRIFSQILYCLYEFWSIDAKKDLASLEALLSELKDERENALMLSTLQLYLKRSIHRLIRNVLYQMARGNEDADAQYTDLLDLKWMKEGTFYSHTRSFFPQAYDFKIVWEEISWQGTPLSLERIQLLVMHSFTLARQRSERELEHSPQTEKNKKALFGKISDIQQKREAFRVQYDIPEQKISGRNIITLA